ncbi:MAG: hypothetical protein LBB75_08885, partial [Oscillospiraceae bacterium]|nr:hypothetical protein [Oscillospiraceae bacterium]
GAYDGLTEAEQAELFALKIEMVLNGMWYNLWDPGAWSGATPIKDPNLRSTTLKNTEKYL